MSHWTHITSCISIETGILNNKIGLKREIQKILRHAPKITGSESDADIFVNIPSGHNFFMSRDCEHCKYKDTIKHITKDGEEYLKCDAPRHYDCSSEYQTQAVISIQGDLRDRMPEETRKEFSNFLNYIKTYFSVRDYSLNIAEDPRITSTITI